jgi:hypothetical protein
MWLKTKRPVNSSCPTVVPKFSRSLYICIVCSSMLVHARPQPRPSQPCLPTGKPSTLPDQTPASHPRTPPAHRSFTSGTSRLSPCSHQPLVKHRLSFVALGSFTRRGACLPQAGALLVYPPWQAFRTRRPLSLFALFSQSPSFVFNTFYLHCKKRACVCSSQNQLEHHSASHLSLVALCSLFALAVLCFQHFLSTLQKTRQRKIPFEHDSGCPAYPKSAPARIPAWHRTGDRLGLTVTGRVPFPPVFCKILVHLQGDASI